MTISMSTTNGVHLSDGALINLLSHTPLYQNGVKGIDL
eukprot:CAMPEP_0171309138 /NCGR_PEP_ID=MMETSP0816-20121228/19282_1 /TAXON_ID=420281 /ORGANISM="Proboscia inermis, Strain CCAP1064/1" /LENGTH=37 /DNA_ID= /DNA_START= /DNA_END= /DNA_ORIENTATION=